MADGHLNKCKACCKRQANDRRAEKLEEVRAYDRRRGKLPHRLELNRGWRNRNKDLMALYRSDWIERYPERRAAHVALNNAVRDGRVLKGPCEACGSTLRVEGHHDDYSKPLEVRWLCEKHHKEHHVDEREIERQSA